VSTAPRRIHSVVLVALFAALTAAGAFVRVPLPTGVPFTLQVPAVLLSGILLGPGRGAASQLAYIAAGLLGLPVFASGGGPGYLLTPSFGFLAGFPLGAAAAGLVAGEPSRATMARTAAGLVCGLLVIYAVGVPWLGWNLAHIQKKPLPPTLLAKFATLYFPLDLLKAALLLPVARAVRARGGLTPAAQR
jgi:biotin transport system substrate-specific component